LLTAAVAVKVTVRADIHDNVVNEKTTSECAQQLVTPSLRSRGNVDDFGAPPRTPGGHRIV
jgi:hypothetical protein